jgi:hypothetical protein
MGMRGSGIAAAVIGRLAKKTLFGRICEGAPCLFVAPAVTPL